MLDDQQIITQAVAQSIRKSANEGVYDLVEAAGVLAAEANPNHALMLAVLQALTAAHDRYTSAYVLAGTDQVLASVGDQPLPQLLQRQPPFDGPGMQDARLVLKRAEAILQFAPVPTTGGGAPLTVVAVYDPAFLRFSLQPGLPGDAWLLNGRGQVLAGLDQSDPFSNLPSRALQQAARKVTRGRTGVMTTGQSLDTQELIGYAPVTGLGPAGQLGWSMVTARRVSNFSLPQADVRRQGILAGILLALLAVLAFLWLYAVIVAPVVRLQRDAERVAYGDLAKSVEVVRYDEIGLAARALERIRVLLIRRRVHGQDKEPPPT